jgi:indolepyruvate ferredoxin oxidoreductase
MGNVNREYVHDNRFEAHGRVYLSGWDALVRLLLLQRERDTLAGLNTSGYVSGYPGSPLGGFDSLLRARRDWLRDRHIHFDPGLNEDIAATAVWGTQYVRVSPFSSASDGVFGMWYGKGPGVERSADAIRTASYQGVAANGGVLAVAGDDHEARSTVTAQQSDTLFMHMHMPVLNPASVQELLDFGLAGWALSRFASTWVGMVCLNELADSAATVDVSLDRLPLVLPDTVSRPPSIALGGGVAAAPKLERDIRYLRIPAAHAFARANMLDRVVVRGDRPRLGIVTSGKAYLDVREALELLGVDANRATELGISVYKVGMTWPLEPSGALAFIDGLQDVVVIEPKHPIIEDQLARVAQRLPSGRRPTILGKQDENGAPLVPEHGGLDVAEVARVLQSRVHRLMGISLDNPLLAPDTRASRRLIRVASIGGTSRAPGLCSGCPHSSSTRLPDGSLAFAGTGCHAMARSLKQPDRQTLLGTHMGGEGGLWLGMAPFSSASHVFQNMGDGTYAHSGSMMIRAAVAAGVSMTFKILLNGTIAMTGGQSLPEAISAEQVAQQVLAEGVSAVAIVTDDPARIRRKRLPKGVSVDDRRELVAVEQRLREMRGVTVLVYDQPCAAELRRDRRRGKVPEPDQRAYIHPDVCEGCGDCNVQSNCVSVEPLETAFGRKRKINQSSCNKDFTCLGGYCPSFVTLYGAKPRQKTRDILDAKAAAAGLPAPGLADTSRPWNVVVVGIGGGGVLTIGALLGMAAHLEGKSVSVLNESGLAQKNGTVQSHIRITDRADEGLSPRIGSRTADVLIATDAVASSTEVVLDMMDSDRTHVFIDREVKPTVDFASSPDMDFSIERFESRIRAAGGDDVQVTDASRVARTMLGDEIYGNMILLGFALQRGALPVEPDSIERAIEINGVAVEANLAALVCGRLLAHDPAGHGNFLHPTLTPDALDQTSDTLDQPFDELVASRTELLSEYQDVAYAERFRSFVNRVAKVESDVMPGHQELATTVARTLSQLMAYKDEYEVARLFLSPAFRQNLDEAFEGKFRLKLNLAPQLLNRRDPSGRAQKREIPWEVALPAFRLLAAMRRFRGSPIDIMGRTKHRRAERARIGEYMSLLDEVLNQLAPETYELCIEVASIHQEIRGFDTVKDAKVALVAPKVRVLLDQLRSAGASSSLNAGDSSVPDAVR